MPWRSSKQCSIHLNEALMEFNFLKPHFIYWLLSADTSLTVLKCRVRKHLFCLLQIHRLTRFSGFISISPNLEVTFWRQQSDSQLAFSCLQIPVYLMDTHMAISFLKNNESKKIPTDCSASFHYCNHGHDMVTLSRDVRRGILFRETKR